MFFHPILLGALGAFVGYKLIARRHFGHGHWHHHHHHHRFGGPRLFRAVRALGLDRAQKQELWSIARELKDAIGAVRFGGFQGLDTLVDAVSGDTFDRASVEAAAQRHGQSVNDAREKIVRAAERVHALLTPEQRQRLRAILGGEPPVGGPDGGPYRTAL
jgi:Spy/CpxP family protein refolding chaperone